MTNTEYETIIKNAAQENDRLKDRVEELEGKLEQSLDHGSAHEPGSIDNNPLCRGCYRWRLAAAAVAGLGCAAIVASQFAEHHEWREKLAVMITGRAEAARFVEGIVVILTAIAPVLDAIVEWKWLLYKNGYAGVFRVIAEVWAVIKKGLGK